MYNFGREGKKNRSKIILSIFVASIMMMPLLLDIDAKVNAKIENASEFQLKMESGWVKHFGGTSWAHVVRQTNDNGYIVVGGTDFEGGDGLVLKTDSEGNELWRKTFPNGGFEGLCITSDGGYIISGIYRGTIHKAFLVKLDEEGNVEWEKKIGESPGGWIVQIQQTSDGGYIGAGTYYSRNGDGWLLKLDANGNELWRKTFGFEDSDDWFHSVYQTDDGGYILPGWKTNVVEMFSDGWILKTDIDGNIEWEKFVDTGEDIIGLDRLDMFNMGRQALDGDFIFTGWASGSAVGERGHFWLVKTDENGNIKWQQNYGKPFFHDLGLWVEPTSDGGYIASGAIFGFGTLINFIKNGLGMPLRNQLLVIKTNSIGEIEWDFTYKDATARCVQETTDGGYIIAGHKGPYYGAKGVLLIKTDENGNIG